jgi:ABC-type glycerol-3-phosphate transport system permease component
MLKSKGRRILVLAVIILLFLSAYLTGVVTYISTDDSTFLYQDPAVVPDNIEVSVQLVSVDAVKREVTARIDFTINGNLTSDQGFSVNQNLKLLVNNASGQKDNNQREFLLEKGKLVPAVDITLALTSGDIRNYPFDSYKMDLVLILIKVPEDNKEQNILQAETVPMGLDIFTNIPNFRLKVTESKEMDEGFYVINHSVERTFPVQFFFIFVMSIFTVVSVTSFLVALLIALRIYRLDTIGNDIFSFLAALLFAFPALRLALPDTPPIGSLADFLVFFWAVGLIGVALVVAIITWLLRQREIGLAKDAKEAQEAKG